MLSHRFERSGSTKRPSKRPIGHGAFSVAAKLKAALPVASLEERADRPGRGVTPERKKIVDKFTKNSGQTSSDR